MLNLEETTYASVIIDNGTESIKVGLAGDEAPRQVIPTLIGYSQYSALDIVMDRTNYSIGASAYNKRGLLDVKRPIVNRRIEDFDAMEKIWHHILLKSLKIDTSQNSVLLTQSCEYTDEDRRKIAEIFFEFFNTPSIYMGNQGMLGLFATGSTKGVALDSGEGGTHVVPVYEGYVSPYSINSIDVSGHNITEHLHNLLTQKGLTFSKHYDFDIVKNIKENKCFVSMDYERELKEFIENANTKDAIYELPDSEKININKEQIEAPEIMFQPQMIGRPEFGVGELIYKSYFSIDTEIRNSLFENIVLVGGNTLFNNFPERLCNNIKSFGGNSVDFKVHAPAERKYTPWIGGSILSCLTPFEGMWVTKKEYEEHGADIINIKSF